MAARRLVVVMLVLLVLSTLAAALLPAPRTREQEPSQPREQTQARQPAKERRPSDAPLLLVARMRVSAPRPKTVRIEHRDRLRLDVLSPFGADVEIPGLGLTGVVTPSAPARFDILATRIGSFPVRTVDPPALAGRLLVARPDTGRCGVATPATPQGRVSAPACAPRGRPASRGSGRSARRP